MPWRCPACRTIIHHNEFEPKPRPGQRYRCHICRIDLMLDPETDRLAMPPDDGPHENSQQSKTAQP